MIIQQTKILEEAAKEPTELDFRSIALKRSLIQSTEDKKQVYRLEAGSTGEERVLNFIRDYGKKHWVVLQNVWMTHYGTFENDLILITRNCVYVFEIKNYTGRLHFKNGVSKFDGNVISGNSINQARKAYLNIKEICEKFSRTIEVRGAVVFAGINNQVTIDSPIEDIEVLTLTDIYEFIQQIIHDERSNNFHKFDPNQLINHFEPFEIGNPYPVSPLQKKDMAKMRQGIACAKCDSFNVKVSKHYIKCKCGLHEPKEEAVIRTICEYGVLFFDRNLSTGELLHFMNHQISREFIQKILATHFDMVLKNKYTFYINMKLPYYKLFERFQMDKPIHFYSQPGKLAWMIYDRSFLPALLHPK